MLPYSGLVAAEKTEELIEIKFYKPSYVYTSCVNFLWTDTTSKFPGIIIFKIIERDPT